MKPEKLVGKLVEIKDNSFYAGHWGFIREWDGDDFHITGGSISADNELTPVFGRDEFVVPRDFSTYIKAGYLKIGVNVTEDGREIRKN